MLKRRLRVWKPLVAVLLCAALPGWADEFGGVRFEVPDDWQASDAQGSRVLQPTDLPRGEVLRATVAGAQAATRASPAEQLAELAAPFNAGVQLTGKTELLETDLGAAGRLYIQNFFADEKGLGAHTRMVAMLLKGNRRGGLYVLVTSSAAMTPHQDEFQELLKSLELTGALGPPPVAVTAPAPAAPKPPPAAAAPAPGRMPTGETPTLFPGMPGWLPTGRGVPIPAARVVGGRPEGLWWYARVLPTGGMVAEKMVFLPDGTRASNPRPGGGTLFDVEGQRAQRGVTGVGTFTVADGKLSQAYDGFTNTRPFSSGADRDGPWFALGPQRFHALTPPSSKSLLGTWTTGGGRYVFREDGTYEMGQVDSTGAWVAASGTRGTWQLDGYLLALRPGDAPMWITTVGATLQGSLVIGTRLFSRP